MKNLYQYITEGNSTRIKFSELANDNKFVKEFNDTGLGMMINPEDEEFDYQWMDINWDRNMIESYMPNNLTNGAPKDFRIKIKWDGSAPWKPEYFKVYQVPGSLVKLYRTNPFNKDLFMKQICKLACLAMNNQ